MGFITQAIVNATTVQNVGTITYNPATRTVIDIDTTTSWEAGTYTSIHFIYTATQSPTNLNGVTFNECLFTPDNVIGMRFSGALSTFNNCIFQFSGNGDATGASLFGNFDGSQGSALTGCTWLTFGEQSAGVPRQWSIALQSVDATIISPSFSDGFITDVTTGAINFGWAHDATVRASTDFVQRFSIRNQQASQAWSAYVQGSFANGSYTIDETDANAGSHYSSGSGGNRIVYTINQTFADWDTSTEGQETYVVSATAAGTSAVFNDGYTWNPRFIQSGTADTIISDASILSIPAGVDAFTIDLDNFDQSAALPAFTGGAWSGSEGNVLFMRSGTGTSSNTALVTVDKALNEDGTLNTDYVVSPRVKSYTHLASTVTSELDLFESYSGGVEGTFVMAESSDVFFPLDVNLNSIILPLNSATATGASVPSSGNMYPAIKGVWYYGSLDEDFEPRIVNGVFTTSKSLELGSSNTYTAGALSVNSAASISASNNVTGISASTISIGGTGFSGITINGATTGNFGAIFNGSNITTTNTASQNVASVNVSSISSVGDLTILGNTDGSSVTTATLVTTGTISTSNISVDSIDTVTGPATFGDGNTYSGNSGTNMTITFDAGLTADQVYTADELLGDGFSIEPLNTVTINSNVDITVETADPSQILAGTAGAGTVTVSALTINATFTHEPSATGGSFAVFERDSATDTTWTQVKTTQRTTTSALASIVVANPSKQYISLWKPKNNVSYTRVSYYDRLTGITEAETNTASTLNIVPEVLSSNDLPATDTGALGFEFTWSQDDAVLGGQLVATIKGTSVNRLTNQQTQAAMRLALVEDFYFDAIVDNILGTASLLPTDVTEGGRADFITAFSSTNTKADGDFIELVSKDGNQQRLTSIDNESSKGTPVTGMLEATITGTDNDGAGISFPAVDIAVNPAGISESQVANAVSDGTLTVRSNQSTLAANQVNLQVATQRGAVKAAAYSAGAIKTDLTV